MKTIKQLFFAAILAAGFTATAQVGVNTETPAATLDVVGDAADTAEMDGIIAPRLTGDQLRAKTYAAAQTGAMVYVTAADSAPAGQTVNVTEAGYYHFDGTEWVLFSDNTNGGKIWDYDPTNTRVYLAKKSDDSEQGATNEVYYDDDGKYSHTKDGVVSDFSHHFIYDDSNRMNLHSNHKIEDAIFLDASAPNVISNSFVSSIEATDSNGKSAIGLLGNVYVAEPTYEGSTVWGFSSGVFVGRSLGPNDTASTQQAFNGIINTLNAGNFNAKMSDTAGSTGLVNLVRGVYVQAGQSNENRTTVKESRGIEVLSDAKGTRDNTVDNVAYGLFVNRVSAAQADVNRAYGIYITNNITASGGTTNKAYALYSTSTDHSYLAGRLGIFTNSPIDALDVRGNITNGLRADAGSRYIGRKQGTTVWGNGAFMRIDNQGGIHNSITLRTAGSFISFEGFNGTEFIRMDPSGNFGIGTPTPGSKLSVVGLPTGATQPAGLTAGDFWVTSGHTTLPDGVVMIAI